MIIINGQVVLENEMVRGAVSIRGGKIVSINAGASLSKIGPVVDAGGDFVAPGFVDCHIHGDPEKIITNELPRGTTSFLFTVSCAPFGKIASTVRACERFKRTHPYVRALLGIYLEGPYINHAKRGAQDGRFIRVPKAKEIREIIRICKGELKMMAIAPELPGAIDCVRALSKAGVTPSLGHTYATAKEAYQGICAGIRNATHLFNGMRAADAPDGGAAGAALSDPRVTCELIFDKIHIMPELFKEAVSIKGVGRIVLISDSVRAEKISGVKLRGGRFVTKDGITAGSAISMIDAVRNAAGSGISMTDSIRMASANPARLAGVWDKKGSIAPGKDADLVIFGKKFNIKTVIKSGTIVKL